jgi:hypothetical protein
MLYLIITTSITSKYDKYNYEDRKQRYIKCITSAIELCKNTNIKVIVVENNGKRNTFLDDLDCMVIYTNNNEINRAHKGVAELDDIKTVINILNITDDDYIIKLTGRYLLLDNRFINICIKEDYEAYVKFFNVATKQFMFNDCVLGLFCIKCKYIKNFEYKCIGQSPEVEFATHVKKSIEHKNILEIINLNLECCFAINNSFLIV